jgi:2-dehydro-3-deoxy-D-arabinonate dehydratase
MATILRFIDPDRGVRVGVQIANTIYDVTEKYPTITAFLDLSVHKAQLTIDALDEYARRAKLAYLASVLDAPSIPHLASIICPVDEQDVWVNVPLPPASEEQAEKKMPPVLFFKAQARHVVGPYGQVGIRKDSIDTVPVGAMALLINPAREVVGYGIGIDMTARDVAAQNPLLLPQAKVYSASCAMGPGFVLNHKSSYPSGMLHMTIVRDKEIVYTGEISLNDLSGADQLIEGLAKSAHFPEGIILLVNTRLTPPADFSLRPNDSIRLSLDGLGTLTVTATQV